MHAESPASAAKPRCTICGGTTFKRAASGRLSRCGNPPVCTECQSYERHRIVRRIYDALPDALLASKRLLQFSVDPSVDHERFLSAMRSVYGGENSLDLMRLDLPDGSFDWIVLNQVLEHVADDKVAMRNLLRVAGPAGIVHINVPEPMYYLTTRDWGFADPAQNWHYRLYGSDMPRNLGPALGDARSLAVFATDPATGVQDAVYFWSPALAGLEVLATPLRAAGFAVFTAW